MKENLTENQAARDWLAIWDEFKTTRSMMQSYVGQRRHGIRGILVDDDEWAVMYQTTELRHEELGDMIFDFLKANG